MNYWPRWINAITNATAALTLTEMGAYDRLLDHAYKTEGPLPVDLESCCRIVRATSKAEREAVRSVLAQFWVLDSVGHTQGRVIEEIAIAMPKIEAARTNGVKGGRPKGTHKKPSGFPAGTQDEPKAKAPHHQIRDNPPHPSGVSPPDGVSEQVWADWLTLRKAKKAPVTATVIDSARREASKAGMTLEAFLTVWCRRGSQGLEADWLKPAERNGSHGGETSWQRSQREKVEKFAPELAAKSPASRQQITLEMEASRVTPIALG